MYKYRRVIVSVITGLLARFWWAAASSSAFARAPPTSRKKIEA